LFESVGDTGDAAVILYSGRRNASPTDIFLDCALVFGVVRSFHCSKQTDFLVFPSIIKALKSLVGEASRLPQEKRTILNILPSVAIKKHNTPKNKNLSHGYAEKKRHTRGKGSWKG
jgi:hypothetical protein